MRRRPARAAAPVPPAPPAPVPAAVTGPPYPPGRVNRMADWAERRAGPAWLPYVLLGLALAVLQVAIQWSDNTYPIGTVDPFNVVVALSVPYMLGLMHYLLRAGARSVREFRPALHGSAADAEELEFRMGTLPARGAFLAGLAVTVVSLVIALSPTLARLAGLPLLTAGLGGEVLLTWPQVFRISPSPLSIGFTAAVTFIAWWTTGAFAYLAVHQLRLIDRIYTEHTLLHLFRLGPLYAFSRQTLRIAVGLLILAYSLAATAPEVVNSGVGGATWLLLVSGAVAVFLIPLLGVHRLLAAEKGRRLDEAGARLEAGTAELHRRMDANDLARMDDLNKALASLELERSALDRIPTWPWERGTLRSLVAAILVPLVIWLVQAALGKLLAG